MPQRLAEGGEAGRHDHELLEVDVRIGVGAAVEDVHQRHRQHRVGAAREGGEVGEQRHAARLRHGAGERHRDAQDGVGAESRLVRRAVELDEPAVDRGLVGLAADERAGDLAVDVRHGAPHAAAQVARPIPVAQLDRLALAGGGARGHRRPPERAPLEDQVDLDGRIAARVEDLAPMDAFDLQALSSAGPPRPPSRRRGGRPPPRAAASPPGWGRCRARRPSSRRRPLSRSPCGAGGPPRGCSRSRRRGG